MSDFLSISARFIVQNEGALRLFAGASPALFGAVLENATAFATNGALKRLLGDREKIPFEQKPFYEPYATGAFTGFTVSFVLCPCDMLKCRAQVAKSLGYDYRIKHIVSSVFQERGPLGFYAGMPSQMLRDIFFYSSFFGSYEVLCHYTKKYFPDLPEAMVYFNAGGIAGQIAWACSIVPDSVKSRIQTSQSLSNLPTGIETFKDIVKQRGYRGLFSGMEVAIVRAYPANAALFVGYEYAKKLSDKLLG